MIKLNYELFNVIFPNYLDYCFHNEQLERIVTCARL